MKVRWNGTKCILCLKEERLSKEHIIPRSLGGILTCKFICRSCNSQLGHELEASVKSDPEVLILAVQSRGVNNKLDELVDSHPQIGQSERGPVTGFIRNDEFQVSPEKLEDGSLIKTLDQTPKTVITMLQRSGSDPVEIEKALEKLDSVQENERTEIAPGIDVVNWSVRDVRPDLSKGGTMNLLVPAIIAFEFLALLVGNAICGDEPALCELRAVFSDQSRGSHALSVDRLHADRAGPSLFHGIVFEGNDPYAKVQIRLLGKLAFRVHFRHLAVNSPRAKYTHELESNEEYCSFLGNTA